MKRPSLARAALAAASAAVLATMTGFAATSASASAAWPGGHGLPPHVFAPYFETYDTSGGPGRAVPAVRRPVPVAGVPGDRPARLVHRLLERRHHASRSPRPASAPTSPPSRPRAATSSRPSAATPRTPPSTDIADSCTSVSAIAQVYENVITTYHVPRIDLDVEADSLTNTAGINRRNEAIAQIEAWAAAHGQRIQFSYTLPSQTTGLTAPGLARAAERDRRRRPDQRGQHHDLRLLHRHRAGDGHRHR